MTETTYTGGCHCGLVRFEATANLDPVIACNCSICTKRGLLLTFIRPEKFALRAGEDELVDYQFGRKIIHHMFCRCCGVESFAMGTGPAGEETVAVNARCLDGIDVSTLKLQPFDGKHM